MGHTHVVASHEAAAPEEPDLASDASEEAQLAKYLDGAPGRQEPAKSDVGARPKWTKKTSTSDPTGKVSAKQDWLAFARVCGT